MILQNMRNIPENKSLEFSHFFKKSTASQVLKVQNVPHFT